ncbi:MAG: NAD(P)-dependent oxidoreductase [Pseudomonadota bacterium]
MSKVAFLGLGVMGYPMAGYLAKAGHEVTVYNRTKSKSQKWVKEFGGTTAATPQDAARGQEMVFACVGNDDDLRDVTIGDQGAFSSMQPSSIFVDHTTVSAKVTEELYQAAANQRFGFIDAPVSGGQAGAENGKLTVMCGGDPDVYASVEPLIMSFAQASRLMGPSGSGQLTKMVNQICIAGLLQGLSEGLAFSKRAGLDSKAVLDVISKGAAGSWQMSNRGETMLEDKFDFGFAVDWMRKDLGICFDEADANGTDLVVAKLVDGYYADVQSMGGGRWDTSSLIRRLTK